MVTHVDITSVLNTFNAPLCSYPEKEIQFIKENWSEFFPLVQQEMTHFIKHEELEYDLNFLLFGTYLLVDMDEKSTYGLLLEMLCADDQYGEKLETVFNDSLTEDMPSILYALNSGEWQTLIPVLEDATVYKYIHFAVLDVLWTLVANGRINKNELIEPLARIFDLAVDDSNSDLVGELGRLFIFLGFDEFKGLYKKLIDEDFFALNIHLDNNLTEFIQPDCFSVHPLPELSKWEIHYPNTNVEKNVSVDALDCFWRNENNIDDHAIINQPYINDYKVGRNEPCPCGSGKKYKKCCLN